ncbi:zinc ribbon domain-containing protein [Thermoflexus sp.]|uniref:zinc ribbon domain-containing protein n=1 Tax=Thermoflexus sp. TaxID=1969742 RepID=UPI002ADDDAE5|nr:zinc ribbon domain-containing protein [Thermoflexus sp.]
MAARIGVESGDGLRTLVQSGIPPRRLLALWEHHRGQPGGPGVGAFLANLRENPEGMAVLADRLLATGHPGPPICPLCGADAGRFPWDRRSWRSECPACGARIRECPRCREPAPADGPCPWCGEPPGDPEGDAEAEGAGVEEPAFPEAIRDLAEAFAAAAGRPPPVWEPDRSRWIRELEAMREAGIGPELLAEAARRLRERGWFPATPMEAFGVAWDLKGGGGEDIWRGGRDGGR